MTSFTSFNSECFCMEDGGCELMTCGHAIHVKCSIKLDKCPWCQQAHIKYIKTDIQRQYVADRSMTREEIERVARENAERMERERVRRETDERVERMIGRKQAERRERMRVIREVLLSDGK
jgi:hypothetical protein